MFHLIGITITDSIPFFFYLKYGIPFKVRYRLISILIIPFKVHDHAAYLVDALIESNRMMKEWQIMVDLLLLDDQCTLFCLLLLLLLFCCCCVSP